FLSFRPMAGPFSASGDFEETIILGIAIDLACACDAGSGCLWRRAFSLPAFSHSTGSRTGHLLSRLADVASGFVSAALLHPDGSQHRVGRGPARFPLPCVGVEAGGVYLAAVPGLGVGGGESYYFFRHASRGGRSVQRYPFFAVADFVVNHV